MMESPISNVILEVLDGGKVLTGDVGNWAIVCRIANAVQSALGNSIDPKSGKNSVGEGRRSKKRERESELHGGECEDLANFALGIESYANEIL